MKWKIMFWVTIGILLMGTISLFVIKENYVAQVMERERAANYSFLGRTAAKAVENRAEFWYQNLFVKTKLVQSTISTTGGNDINIETDNELGKDAKEMGSAMLNWWDARIRVLWMGVYNFLLRISMFMLWLPLGLLAVIPVMVDSIVSRKIKSTSFAITSPHLHLLGSGSIFWFLLSYAVLLCIPVMLHPVMTPTVIFLACAALWLSVSQFAKRA